MPLRVPSDYHISAKHTAQLTKEAKRVVKKLLRYDVDNYHQLAHRELLRHIGTVQAVPFTLCVVAALITVAICIVIFAVLVVQRIALSLQVLAIKAIKEASSVVTL